MPVVDRVAADLGDRVRFLAVAGRSTQELTAERAGELFSHLDWALADDVWRAFDVPYQPVTVLLSGGADKVEVDRWFGALSEEDIRSRVERLAG